MNVDDLLRDALRDDRYALPSWPDASARIRAGVARRRRRRVATLLAATAIVAVVAGAGLARTPWRHPTAGHPSPTAAEAGTPSPGQVVPWLGRTAAAPPSSSTRPDTDLWARIDVASSVDPGGELAYVVTLENRSGRVLPLDPCPVVTQYLGTDGGSYLLNCVVRALPAGSWIRLETRLRVPASAPAGSATLTWTLFTVDGRTVTATATVTVR